MLRPEDVHYLKTWLNIAERWEDRANRVRRIVEQAFESQTTKGVEEMVAYSFNSQGIDASYGGGGGGLPVGKHPVVIEATALRDSTTGGGYMELTLRAIDGPAKGGTQLDRLNLHNRSQQAVEIANKQLAAYCAVTGVGGFNDTAELHNKPFVIEVGPQKDNPQYTEVKKLFDSNGNEPGKAGNGPQQSNNNGGYGGNGGFQQNNNGGGFQQNGNNGGGSNWNQSNGNDQSNNNGGNNGGQSWGGGQGGGAGASGTGSIPDQQGHGGAQGNGGGSNWGGNGGGGGQGGGGGSTWQQGGNGGGNGGSGPSWGQR